MGCGGLARGIQDPFLPTTSFVRPTPPHAILYPVFHQGKSLGAGVPGSPPQTSHRTGSSDSRLLQSPICGPDLSTLNTYIASQRFHMETPQFILHYIRQGDWMISLDLQDAYLQVPTHPESRRYLRFTMGGVSYQFRVLCFGLTTAPQVFTRLMAPISAILHRYGIRNAQISRRLVDSRRIQDRLYPGEGQTPSSVRGAGITSQFQEVVLDPISGHDLSRHADPISSVRCKTDRDKGRQSPQDHRGVSFIPGPPSSSLASFSGPPFVP